MFQGLKKLPMNGHKLTGANTAPLPYLNRGLLSIGILAPQPMAAKFLPKSDL